MKKLSVVVLIIGAVAISFFYLGQISITHRSDDAVSSWDDIRFDSAYAWDPATDKYWTLELAMTPATVQSTMDPSQFRWVFSHIGGIREFCCLQDDLRARKEQERRRELNPNDVRNNFINEMNSDSDSSGYLDYSAPILAQSAALMRLDGVEASSFLVAEVREEFDIFTESRDDIYLAHLAIIKKKTESILNDTLIDSWVDNVPRAVIFSDRAYFDLRKAGAAHSNSREREN